MPFVNQQENRRTIVQRRQNTNFLLVPTVLHGFPADYEQNIAQLKSVLQRKEIELETCKEISHAKTLEIEMLERTVHGI